MASHNVDNDLVLLNARLEERGRLTYPNRSGADVFLLDSVDTVLRQRNLSHQEIEDGVVDGADDGGIDAVYTFVNGILMSDSSAIPAVDSPSIELELVQAKTEAGFKESELQKLIDHLPQLLALSARDADLLEEFNERLVDRFAVFRQAYLGLSSKFPSLHIRHSYVTKAIDEANPKVAKKCERLKAVIEASYSTAHVAISLIGARDLNRLARARATHAVSLRVAETPLSTDRGGMVCLVRLDDYNNFISDEDGRLRDEIFEENVRGYEGETLINRGIAASLRAGDAEPVDFWWLNNGVTVIGSRVQPAGKMITIEDPQVVNGLQTSRTLHTHYSLADGQPKKSDRHLLVRVIETTDEAIASQVIRATNSQNRVPVASLRAAEPFQRSIEEYFLKNGRYYERRRNHYKNQGKQRDLIVEVQELAQAVASILLASPEQARGKPSTLVRYPLYEKVFNEKTPLAIYFVCIQVFDIIDTFLANAPMVLPADRSNLRFHLARALTAVGLRTSRPKPQSMALLDLAKLTPERLEAVLTWILGIRDDVTKSTGQTDPGTLAKSSEWSRQIDAKLSRYSDKQNWPKALDSGFARTPNPASRPRRVAPKSS